MPVSGSHDAPFQFGPPPVPGNSQVPLLVGVISVGVV
jgi:hypothetical protein